jgi:hypothetical protein
MHIESAALDDNHNQTGIETMKFAGWREIIIEIRRAVLLILTAGLTSGAAVYATFYAEREWRLDYISASAFGLAVALALLYGLAVCLDLRKSQGYLPKAPIGAAAFATFAAVCVLSQQYQEEYIVLGVWAVAFLIMWVSLDYFEEVLSNALAARAHNGQPAGTNVLSRKLASIPPVLTITFLALGSSLFLLEKAQQRAEAARRQAEHQSQLARCEASKRDPGYTASQLTKLRGLRKQVADIVAQEKQARAQNSELPIKVRMGKIIAESNIASIQDEAQTCGIHLDERAGRESGSTAIIAMPQIFGDTLADQRARCIAALQAAEAEATQREQLNPEYFKAMAGWTELISPKAETQAQAQAPGHLINCIGYGLEKEDFWIASAILHGRLSPTDAKANLFKCAEVLGRIGAKIEGRVGKSEAEQLGMMFGRGLGMAVTSLNVMIKDFNVTLPDILNRMAIGASSPPPSDGGEPLLRRASLETCQWFGYSLEHVVTLAE